MITPNKDREDRWAHNHALSQTLSANQTLCGGGGQGPTPKKGVLDMCSFFNTAIF